MIRIVIAAIVFCFAFVACEVTESLPTIDVTYLGSQTINGQVTQIKLLTSKENLTDVTFSAVLSSVSNSFAPLNLGCNESVVFTTCQTTAFGSDFGTKQVTYNGTFTETSYSGTLEEKLNQEASVFGTFSLTKQLD